MTKPLISLLIPTYQRPDWLREALASAAGQETAGRFDLEIVVVDNDSGDATRATIEEASQSGPWPVHYVHWTRRGDAQARNGGLPRCRGDWIAFMDDDEIAQSNWLLHMFDTALRCDADLVGGAVELLLSAEKLAGLGIDVRRSLRERTAATCGGGDHPRPFHSREFPGTDNLLISRDVLDSLGAFDESLMSGTADYDFSVRARRAGFRCWFAPQAIVRHRVPARRLTEAFIDWESQRSGVMLAQYDRKYKGRLGVLLWMGLRLAQGALVTFPRWLMARCSGNVAELSDRRIRLQRLKGYAESFLCETFPLLFRRQRLYQRLDFIKGREIGGPETNALIKAPLQEGSPTIRPQESTP